MIERDLPEGRHQLLKEFVMTEIQTRPPRRRLRVLAPVLGLVAAAGVAVPLLLHTPAYAVEKNPDGTVTVTINDARNADGLEGNLRGMGYNVTVDYVAQGKHCSPEPRAAHYTDTELTVFPPPHLDEPGWVLNLDQLRAGETGVLEFSVADSGRVAAIWARVADGPVADCTLVDSTDAPLSHPGTEFGPRGN
ncbi:MAG: hypothetical protein HOY71_30275 [Nonomuraea sp.]|nr:hypothetical protein [Nonomuraea sp.]